MLAYCRSPQDEKRWRKHPDFPERKEMIEYVTYDKSQKPKEDIRGACFETGRSDFKLRSNTVCRK